MVSGKLDARVKAMEAVCAAAANDAAMADDAAAFTDRILAIASGLPESDALAPAAERLARFSGAQRLAWALRFGGEEDWTTANRRGEDLRKSASEIGAPR